MTSAAAPKTTKATKLCYNKFFSLPGLFFDPCRQPTKLIKDNLNQHPTKDELITQVPARSSTSKNLKCEAASGLDLDKEMTKGNVSRGVILSEPKNCIIEDKPEQQMHSS